MVHQTNNSQKFSEQTPFDVMLRRQLRGAGQAAAPCAGFDADTANAYLERALLSTAQQTFEAHLADCTGCRQHVTALMMLNAQLAPSPVEIPTARTVAQPSLWSRWTSQFNEWRSSFDLNWGFAGAGAAMAALLITFTVYQWQSRTAPTNSADVAQVSQAPVQQAEFRAGEVSPAGNVMPDSAIAPLIQTNTIMTGNATAAISPLAEKAVGVAPTPPSLPNLSGARPHLTANGFATEAAAPAPMRVIDSPEESVAFNSAPISAPVISLTANRDFFGGSFAGNGNLQTPVSLSHNGGLNNGLMPGRMNSIEPQPTVSSLNSVKEQLVRQSSMSDLAAVEPHTVAREDADKSNAKTGKAELSRTRAIINALTGQRSALGFVAGKGAEARTKEAEKTTSEPQANPLTKRVNGHLFYFERGFWIDENYRSDTTMPLVKLTRGTERYQNLLIENPTLEQFFQLGQVIVVWKGKVYEVRK